MGEAQLDDPRGAPEPTRFDLAHAASCSRPSPSWCWSPAWWPSWPSRSSGATTGPTCCPRHARGRRPAREGAGRGAVAQLRVVVADRAARHAGDRRHRVLHGLRGVRRRAVAPLPGHRPGRGGLLAAALLVSPLWIRLIYWPGTLSRRPWSPQPACGRCRGRRGGDERSSAGCSWSPCSRCSPTRRSAAPAHRRARAPARAALARGGARRGDLPGRLRDRHRVVFALNGLAFDTFGVTIAGWRRPNELSSLHDLRVNARPSAPAVRRARRDARLGRVAGLVSVGYALADARCAAL